MSMTEAEKILYRIQVEEDLKQTEEAAEKLRERIVALQVAASKGVPGAGQIAEVLGKDLADAERKAASLQRSLNSVDPRRLQVGMMQASYAISDFASVQGGLQQKLGAVANNIQYAAMQFGPYGIAAGAAVGVTQVLIGAFNSFRSDAVKELTGEVERLTAAIKRIEAQPVKLKVDLADMDAAKARLKEIREDLSAFERAGGLRSKIEREAGSEASEAIGQAGGKRVRDEVREQFKARALRDDPELLRIDAKRREAQAAVDQFAPIARAESAAGRIPTVAKYRDQLAELDRERGRRVTELLSANGEVATKAGDLFKRVLDGEAGAIEELARRVEAKFPALAANLRASTPAALIQKDIDEGMAEEDKDREQARDKANTEALHFGQREFADILRERDAELKDQADIDEAGRKDKLKAEREAQAARKKAEREAEALAKREASFYSSHATDLEIARRLFSGQAEPEIQAALAAYLIQVRGFQGGQVAALRAAALTIERVRGALLRAQQDAMVDGGNALAKALGMGGARGAGVGGGAGGRAPGVAPGGGPMPFGFGIPPAGANIDAVQGGRTGGIILGVGGPLRGKKPKAAPQNRRRGPVRPGLRGPVKRQMNQFVGPPVAGGPATPEARAKLDAANRRQRERAREGERAVDRARKQLGPALQEREQERDRKIREQKDKDDRRARAARAQIGDADQIKGGEGGAAGPQAGVGAVQRTQEELAAATSELVMVMRDVRDKGFQARLG
jgi:hypothetical protein